MKRMALFALFALSLSLPACKKEAATQNEKPAESTMLAAAVANAKIVGGSKISKEMVVFQESPEEFLPTGFITKNDFEEYVGRSVRVTIPEGGILVKRDFEGGPEAGDAAAEKGTDDGGEGSKQKPIVRKADDAEKRIGAGGKAEATLLARGENAFLGLLSMEGGVQVPEHRDPTEEYIYVLEGSGTMVIDGKDYEVSAGTAIYMPADAKVTFSSAEPVKAVQVFAGPGPADKYQKWDEAK